MYKVINVNNRIENGVEKEVKVLFENSRAKIAQLTLRKNKILVSHEVNVPIVIQCIAGIGELIIENGIEKKRLSLLPRTIIALEANVLHSIVAKPSVSLLLLKLSNAK